MKATIDELENGELEQFIRVHEMDMGTWMKVPVIPSQEDSDPTVRVVVLDIDDTTPDTITVAYRYEVSGMCSYWRLGSLDDAFAEALKWQQIWAEP